jgi:hypothetical protein
MITEQEWERAEREHDEHAHVCYEQEQYFKEQHSKQVAHCTNLYSMIQEGVGNDPHARPWPSRWPS